MQRSLPFRAVVSLLFGDICQLASERHHLRDARRWLCATPLQVLARLFRLLICLHKGYLNLYIPVNSDPVLPCLCGIVHSSPHPDRRIRADAARHYFVTDGSCYKVMAAVCYKIMPSRPRDLIRLMNYAARASAARSAAVQTSQSR